MSRVRTMQRGLEKALHRAKLADDRELAGHVREEGRRFVFLLNGLIRSSRLYQSENTTFDAPAAETAATLAALVQRLGAVHVVCVEEHIYMNDIRLRAGSADQPVIDAFVSELDRHAVGGLSFHDALSPDAVKALARALSQPVHDGAEARAALLSRIQGLADLELTGRYRFRVTGERVAVKRTLSQVMHRAAVVAAEAVANLGANRLPNPLD